MPSRDAPVRLGKYEILRTLGQGGMARAELAAVVQPHGGTLLVALKRLRASAFEDEDARAMLVREGHIAARMRHPNIVALYEVETIGDEILLSMEYLEGESLRAIMRECARHELTVPLPIALRIVCDALAGLAYAHALRDADGTPLGIVHRDVSPQNLVVTYDGETKIIDFGIARAAYGGMGTVVGAIKGKLGYMAPEQAAGLAVDRRADLFAIGIVLWELLAGGRLARASTFAAALDERMNFLIPALRERLPDLPAPLEAILTNALARSPDERTPTALAMRRALDGYARSSNQHASREDVARFVGVLFRAVSGTVVVREQPGLPSSIPPPCESDTVVMNPDPRASARPTWWPYAAVGCVVAASVTILVALALLRLAT